MLSILLIISCSRCKEKCTDATNPDCPNYDPCLSQIPFTADFKMVSSGGIDPAGYEVLDGDTGWCKSTFRFIPLHQVDSVKWILGSDPTVHTQTNFTINFELAYYNVPVTCIAYGKQNSQCFGVENVIDTVVKHLTVVQWPDLPIWNWRFMCHYDDEPQTEFEIHFEIVVNPNSPPTYPLGDQEMYGLTHLNTCQFAGCGQYNHSFVDLNGGGSHPSGCLLEPTYNPDGYVVVTSNKQTISGVINDAAQRSIVGYRVN